MNREEIEQGIARLERQFMTPNIWKEDVWVVETVDGTDLVPASLVPASPIADDFLDYVQDQIVEYDLKKDAWCAQLSASGYMDQTELSLHESEEEAAAYLVEEYDNGEEVDNEA